MIKLHPPLHTSSIRYALASPITSSPVISPQIQFDGLRCDAPNLPYYISFSAFFFLIGAVCLAQLVICVRAEFARMKTPSLLRACRVTTQKALYVLIFAAAVLRGLYFAAPVSRHPAQQPMKAAGGGWRMGWRCGAVWDTGV